MAEKQVSGANDHLGTGRRKSAVARVRVRPGSGKVLINERPLEEFFKIEQDRQAVLAPLKATGQTSSVDVVARVNGGGLTGQSGAMTMGLARALMSFNTELEPALRHAGLLTRDSRMKARKKYGRKGARKSFQFSKR